jgi:hypothetical protein
MLLLASEEVAMKRRNLSIPRTLERRRLTTRARSDMPTLLRMKMLLALALVAAIVVAVNAAT